MRITAVESTTIATVGYDDALELLKVEFRSHAIYEYFGVPASVHDALLGAQSKGGFFNRVIRRGFRYCRVSGLDQQGGGGVAAGGGPR